MEDRDSWTGVVIAGDSRRSGVADDRDAGWQGAVCHRRRSRQRQDHSRPQAVRRRDAAVRAQLQHLRVAHAGRGTGTGVRHVRIARDRVPRPQERQGAVDAPRSGVQSLPRRRVVADHLRQPADHALRRQRPAVSRRARQEDRQDGVEDRSLDRLPGSRPGRQAGRRGRPAEGVRDAAHHHGERQAAPDQQRREGDLRLRSADRQGDLARRGTQQSLRQHAPRGRPRPRSTSRPASRARICSRCVPTDRVTSPRRTSPGAPAAACPASRRCSSSAISST